MAGEDSIRYKQGRSSHINTANTITILRYPLLVFIVWLLYQESRAGKNAAVGLIILLILMDTLDGVVARRRHETTLLGSALDIATDRAVEIVLWVVYAHLRLIPVAIPLVVIIRGMLTDSIRAVALQHGISAHQMMRTTLGKWLVASPPMRTGYAIVKIVAFVTLALTLALQANNLAWTGVYQVAQVVSWLAVVICLARGLPVLLESPSFFRSLEQD
ncbi:MAG: CDP-alcohol phosphatidyltransferase family protein [Anaerolineales bacterium]|nr:CDP-alcohol phosphatidyltransferase family protein [Anaerolineales bacterium]MCB8952689.1 CDP-alcohol phosphatidyltransferase family protein [Ardenticatenales bacterium]